MYDYKYTNRNNVLENIVFKDLGFSQQSLR